MGKGYYIFFGTNSSGVLQKIDMQIEELSAVCPVELISVEKKKRTFVKKVLSRIPFCPIGYDYDRVLSQIKDPEFIYVRRPVADSEYVNFFGR